MIHAVLLAILLIICVCIFILSIPHCNRLKQNVVEVFARLSGRYLQGGVYLFYTFVGLLLVGQLLEITSIRGGDASEPLRAERLLSAQRDAYLAGSVFMLFLCMSKIYELIRESNRLKASKEAILRQAQGASSFARKTLEEKTAKEKSKKDAVEKKGKAQQASAQTQKDQAALLKLRAEKKKLTNELKTLKSQSESQSKECTRLLDENKSLKNQLQDFEVLMGDQKKKTV